MFAVKEKKHPNKEIQQAIDYALNNGWRRMETGGSSHAYCRLYCGEQSRDGCKISVWTTPRNPEVHARQIQKQVDNCPHLIEN